jgi:TatD DNase family protein
VNRQSLRLTDVHAHLCDTVFDRDRESVLARAREAGVAAVIAVAENLAEAQKTIELAAVYPMIRPAAGLYPTRLSREESEEMRAFVRTNRSGLWAVGEVGLDYWMVQEEEARELQREIFGDFVELAKELELPLNVHSRSAGRHAVDFLLQCDAKRVHLHAFDGKASAALSAVEAGYFFSIPPSVVRSGQKQKLVRRLPLSCLLIETDSPVLGPTPEERNEPCNAVIALRAVAELKGIPVEEVAAAVSENTYRLYGI